MFGDQTDDGNSSDGLLFWHQHPFKLAMVQHLLHGIL
jgi:hypothetical protein